MGKPIRNTALFRTITGRNKTGEIIHGILDVLPLPNFHELLKSRAKKHPDLSLGSVTKLALKGLDPLRTIISTGIGVSIIFCSLKRVGYS